ncbi:MAG: hypothetical protein M3P94_07250 [Chloroflexota bacterium]|nr:hypothetical protein [Chloroflexota bacterium]
MSDDALRLRARQSAERMEIPEQNTVGNPAMLAQILAPTVSGAALGAGLFFSGQPIIIIGNETEGGPATFTAGPADRIPILARSRIPVVGSATPAYFAPYRWINDDSSGSWESPDQPPPPPYEPCIPILKVCGSFTGSTEYAIRIYNGAMDGIGFCRMGPFDGPGPCCQFSIYEPLGTIITVDVYSRNTLTGAEATRITTYTLTCTAVTVNASPP